MVKTWSAVTVQKPVRAQRQRPGMEKEQDVASRGRRPGRAIDKLAEAAISTSSTVAF